jgi:hypothetical protein
MATTRLYRTFGTPTLATKYTCSFWMKRCSNGAFGSISYIFNSYSDANNWGIIRFTASDQLEFFQNASSSTQCQLITSRLFRDSTAWYHVVIAVDTTQGTPADRNKMYINGIQETNFSTETNFGSSDTGVWNAAYAHTIGRNADSGGNYFDGLMAHFHWIDGLQYAASDFGETDATSGIWVPKTSPSVTYGNNGCFLKFQDTAAYGDDSSGNTNDFTVVGTPTQTKDTPNNNFCTSTPIVSNSNTPGKATLSNGCLTQSIGGSGQTNWGYPASIGVTKGKWYMEYEMGSTAANVRLGIIDDGTLSVGDPDSPNGNTTIRGPGLATADYGNSWGYYSADGNFYYNASGSAYGSSFTTAGDIIGCAFDADTGKLYFSKNGTWQNSGDPAAGSNPMVTITIEDGVSYFFHCTGYSNDNWDLNFGNGYFGTTLITSPEADDAGEGAFKYDVPAGFYALCTNNLATYG